MLKLFLLLVTLLLISLVDHQMMELVEFGMLGILSVTHGYTYQNLLTI